MRPHLATPLPILVPADYRAESKSPYNTLELHVSSILKDFNQSGYLLSNIILGEQLEVDHLLFTESGQIYIIECKNYTGLWSGGINSQWSCTDTHGITRDIKANPTESNAPVPQIHKRCSKKNQKRIPRP